MKGLYLILLSFLFGCNLPDMQTGKEVSYYFDQPAQIWEETLPLGNGRIGMMPDGGIERENVVLNEISLWSGSKQDTDNPWKNTYRKRNLRISPPCAGNIHSLIAPCLIGSLWIWEKAKGIIFRSMSVWPLSLKIRTIRDWRLYISSSVDIY